MIKTTLRQLLNARPVLAVIASPTNQMKAKSIYQFTKRMNAINSEYKEYEKVRYDLVRKYGTEHLVMKDDKEVRAITVTPENMPLFKRELDDLLNTEVTLNVEPLNIDHLDGLFLNFDQMTALGNLIEE